MKTARSFEPLTPDSADPAARPLMLASQAKFGFLPAPLARAAHSPALLAHLLAGFAAFERSSLSLLEREVVAMTVAYEIECHYCVAMHSALLARSPSPDPQLVAALRSGSALADPRLDALRRFVRAVVREHGRPSEAEWHAMDQAGYGAKQALDALLGVGVYLTSTLTNVVTDSPLDRPFESFRWHKTHPTSVAHQAATDESRDRPPS